MHKRWLTFLNASLAAFACLVVLWQVVNRRDGEGYWLSSITLSAGAGEVISQMTNILEKDAAFHPAAGTYRWLGMVLPKEAHVLITGMDGTNAAPNPPDILLNPQLKTLVFTTYYFFPREVAASIERSAPPTPNGFLGRLATAAMSDEEILANGFDVRMDMRPDDRFDMKTLREMPIGKPVNPDWFASKRDPAIACLLPLLTALTGMWLLRCLFPALANRLPWLEQLAGGLGLGMMAVTALTLAVKLCGWHGRGLVLVITAAGALLETWRDRKVFLAGIIGGLSQAVRNPLVLVGLPVFLILFRLAGLLGLVEYDALMSWALKAKILHGYTGSELVKWFSTPRLALAHLDYPTLVPSLHAATYDSVGHVDEFVTKFWPTWMLLLLIGALASLNRGRKAWGHGPYYFLLGLLLLPAIQKYVRWEGATMPMVFYTVMGMVECAVGLMERDHARLGLGLTLLFGAAMTKYEGFIFLALAVGWLVVLPWARSLLRWRPGLWRVGVFWLAAALPFVCLRLQITSVNFESGWAGYALRHPGITLSSWPVLFGIVLCREFLNTDFASWGADDGGVHWIGKWEGVSSLYNHWTLGLAWLCLLMTVAAWFAAPGRRPVILWTVAVVVSAMAALSGVIASLVSIRGLPQVIAGYNNVESAGRYLFPILVAWPATMITAAFSTPTISRPTSAGSG